MPFVDTRTGARLHYEHLNAQSDKTPVVVVHGLLGTGRKDLGHVLDWLADDLDYPVIAPTLRGYGQSTPKPRTFPMRFYKRDADDLLAFLEALHIQQAHLLGYSDGGEAALIAAGTNPERFATVAVIGSVGYFGAQVRIQIQGYRPGSEWITDDELTMHGITDADAFMREWSRSMIQMVNSGGDVSLSLAEQMTCPLLIMLGKDDSLNPADYARTFISRTPQGYLEVFDCGHAVHDEQTERFQQIYRAHLQRA
jgi:valacyclovir hydrolase